MPRKCSICNHIDRDEIDKALLAGEPYRHIACQYETSTATLRRHREHIAPSLALAVAENEKTSSLASADEVLRALQDLHAEARSILQQARDTGKLGTALQAINQASRCVEVLVRAVAAARNVEQEVADRLSAGQDDLLDHLEQHLDEPTYDRVLDCIASYNPDEED